MDDNVIIENVTALMNELDDGSIMNSISEDTVLLEDYIRKCIPDAVNFILSMAPASFVYFTSAGDNVSISVTERASVVAIPNDFLRFGKIKFSSWKRPVCSTLDEQDDAAKKCYNDFIRPGVHRPVVLMCRNNVLLCFPKDDHLDHFYYAKKINGMDDLSVVSDVLLGSICYMCASLVYNIFENNVMSEQMKARSIELIPRN